MILDLSISPDVYGKLVGGALTLIVAGVGYIARQAHLISEAVGKTSRALFGEDGEGGIKAGHLRLERRVDRHDNRLTRIETHLDMPERREFP
jgi:hypothetical protein